MLSLPNDVQCAILGRAEPKGLVAFACTCSEAARSVSYNRLGIVACRSPAIQARSRALSDLRELFPDTEIGIFAAEHFNLRSKWSAMVYPESATTETIVGSEMTFGSLSRTPLCGCMPRLFRPPLRRTLDALIVPACATGVQISVGNSVGGNSFTLSGAVIAAMANGRPEVDIVDVTLGRGFPVGRVHMQNLRVVVYGPLGLQFRATFTSGWTTPAWRNQSEARVSILRSGPPVLLHSGQLVSYFAPTPNICTHELIVLVRVLDTGAIVDDVLDTICVCVRNKTTPEMMMMERTFSADALRGCLNPHGRWIRTGYVLPIVNACDLSTRLLKFRLTAKVGVDPARYTVTFAHVQGNLMNVAEGTATLVFEN